jgi:hypothetical protein
VRELGGGAEGWGCCPGTVRGCVHGKKGGAGRGLGNHSRCTCTLCPGRRGEDGGGGMRPRWLAPGCQQDALCQRVGVANGALQKREGCQHSSIHLLTARGGGRRGQDKSGGGEPMRGEAQQARSEQVGWIAAAYERTTKEREGRVMGRPDLWRREGGNPGSRTTGDAADARRVCGWALRGSTSPHARCWRGYKCWGAVQAGGKGGAREPGAAGKRGAASRHEDRACRCAEKG